MRRSTEARPNGILDLGIDPGGPEITDVYASEEDQRDVQAEADEYNRPVSEPAHAPRSVHVHVHQEH